VMASKSEKQRALYRSREEAKANGTLPAWYAAREADRSERTERAPPPAAPPPPVPFKSPERTAWERAYSGAEVGPAAVRWEPSGATIRATWLLQTCPHR
jgi:hypothetical protein